MEIQDRYEIRRKLGQGGVGAVYEGFDHQLRRRVAIKRLLETEEARSQSVVQDLLKECHSLSALNSPNIVQLFDFGEDQDGPFVVMELLEGETLETLIKRAPFTEEDFMVLAEQSLEGLLAAHNAHLLHRDLKPCNFMVTWLPSGRMQLKILDFGLAKFSTEPSKQTIAHGNSLIGSIYFMAPEQFEQFSLDGRTDLYALGAVFYYALAGTYPFHGESVAQVMASHLTGHYKDLREYRPDLNPLIAKWVMSLISRNPNDRPENCALALSQFMGILSGTFIPEDPIIPTGLPQTNIPGTTPPASLPPQTGSVSLLLPGAERNTGPISLNTGPVTLPPSTPQSCPTEDPPPMAPSKPHISGSSQPPQVVPPPAPPPLTPASIYHPPLVTPPRRKWKVFLLFSLVLASLVGLSVFLYFN